MPADMDIDFTRRNKKPRPLTEHEKEKLDEFVDAIHYSARFVVYLVASSASTTDAPLDTQTTSMSTAMYSCLNRC